MIGSNDSAPQQYSLMTDDEKLKVLITELQRDTNDMKFNPQDRFVFDVDVPLWVSVLSKISYTMFLIPLIFFLIMTIIFGVPTKVMRLSSMILVIIFYSLDLFDRKKPKDNAQKSHTNIAASTMEYIYRASLLPESGYTMTFVLTKIIMKAFYTFLIGVFIFSLVFSLVWGF